jgi:hypothetical protein
VGNIQSLALEDITVCACGPREYKARDAIDAAVFRAEIDPAWREFLQETQAEKRAEELELELDDEAVNAAVETFRYEHDLITAEETEQWLALRGLDLEDFGDYFARRYWLGTVEEEIESDEAEPFSSSSDLRKPFIADLILSDKLDFLTTELMWRLAALAADVDEKTDAEKIAAERQKFFDRNKITAQDLPVWLDRIGRDMEWFEEMLALEAAYQRRRQALLNPQARARELATMRMPLTRFEADVVEVESRDAAREIVLCIREDGISMEEAAAEGRYPYRSVAFLRQDVPADFQQKFLSVSVGDILDPVARGDGFELYQITGKVEPDPDDPAVQVQIDKRLVERHFSELASKHVEPRLGFVVSQR